MSLDTTVNMKALSESHRKTNWCWLFCLLLPFTVAAIEFEINGVDDNIESNVLAFLSSRTYVCLSVVSPISRQHKDLLDQVQAAIQPFGYFNAKATLQAKKTESCETVVIDIQPGPLTVIESAKISVSAGQDQDFIQILENHGIGVGQPLNQSKYDALKNKLLGLANEKFYLDAKFTDQKITVYPEQNSAAIRLTFDTGPRYRVGPVNVVVDQPFLEADLMHRMISIKANEFITQNQLYQLKQKLNSYGYFSQVRFDINQHDPVTVTVPITITLSPAAKYDYSVGLGYSTDAGAKSSFKYNNHRINTKGHQLNSQLNLSELRNELSASYKIPAVKQPAAKWYNIQLGYRDEQSNNIDSQTSKLGLSQTRIHANSWQNITFIDVLHEKFDTGMEQGESLLLVPGISWSLTDADSLTRTTRGYKIQAEFKGASEDLWSDAAFAQLTLGGKFIHKAGDANRLIYRAQFGATASSDFNQLPTTYRFFAGGDHSIRGYDYQTISPLNSSGDLAGGKHMAIGSIEFEHQFAPQWAVAAFTDFGDAFSDNFDLKYSVGAGLRWFSPIGPIRIDVGVPLNQEASDFRLHVTIGPDL